MIENILALVARHWPVALLIVLVLYLAANYFHHGLYKYPGPFLAHFTDWWRFFVVLGRRPDIHHQKLHRQHGDVVRLGPNVLSFSSPAALKQIYGLNKGMTKVRFVDGYIVKLPYDLLTLVVWVLSRPDGRLERQTIALSLLHH